MDQINLFKSSVFNQENPTKRKSTKREKSFRKKKDVLRVKKLRKRKDESPNREAILQNFRRNREATIQNISLLTNNNQKNTKKGKKGKKGKTKRISKFFENNIKELKKRTKQKDSKEKPKSVSTEGLFQSIFSSKNVSKNDRKRKRTDTELDVKNEELITLSPLLANTPTNKLDKKKNLTPAKKENALQPPKKKRKYEKKKKIEDKAILKLKKQKFEDNQLNPLVQTSFSNSWERQELEGFQRLKKRITMLIQNESESDQFIEKRLKIDSLCGDIVKSSFGVHKQTEKVELKIEENIKNGTFQRCFEEVDKILSFFKEKEGKKIVDNYKTPTQ